jgi:transcriptional regulator with XRE-family HTH domain
MKLVRQYGRREIAQAFGATLRDTRKARGISQDKLAVLCDFDRTYPSLIERGLRQPTLSMLLRLADALDTVPTKLVEDTLANLQIESPG